MGLAFVAIFSQIKLLFGPLVIQLVWYILNKTITCISLTLATYETDIPNLALGTS